MNWQKHDTNLKKSNLKTDKERTSLYYNNTVKPAYVSPLLKVTFIKRSLYLVLSLKITYKLKLCFIRPIFLCPKGELLMQV